MSDLEILTDLEVRRLDDGRRELITDLLLKLDGEEILIPKGFVTDYSSWPRCLPGPNYSRIDIAGIVHDYIFKYGRLGQYGDERVGYVEANRYWYRIARAGAGETSAGPLWAWAGRLGLFVGSWPVWLKYRKVEESA